MVRQGMAELAFRIAGRFLREIHYPLWSSLLVLYHWSLLSRLGYGFPFLRNESICSRRSYSSSVCSPIKASGQFPGSAMRFLSLLLLQAFATLLVSISYGTFAPGIIGPSWPNLKAAFRSGELFISTYFLFALILIILMALSTFAPGLLRCRGSLALDLSNRLLLVEDLISNATCCWPLRFRTPSAPFSSIASKWPTPRVSARIGLDHLAPSNLSR